MVVEVRSDTGGETGSPAAGHHEREDMCVVFACIIPFRIPHLWSVYGCNGGLCEDDYSITIFQNQPVVLIREGFPLAYSLLPSVGNVGRCMGGDAAKAATRSVRRQLELTEMTSETSLLAAHLRPYSTASSSGILGASS